ncbi:MAG: hypothetical protein IBJ18_07900 [Phycisphaerales bacterium]|nr:hypothetical protein [Phycisphaerales bacterium]
MRERLDMVISQWARLGAGFSAAESAETPDLERLLLETAREAPGMARLFILAATWLHRYGGLIAKHRLKRLIRDELDRADRAALGLLLDIAQQGTHPAEFASVLRDLSPRNEPCPLFEVERTSAELAARSRRRASLLSVRWGLWCEEIELRDDALRPASWIMARNPDLIARADFRGDLRASVLASLKHDAGSGSSELELARRSGGSRAQIRSALLNLELTGKAIRSRTDRDKRTRISLGGFEAQLGMVQ